MKTKLFTLFAVMAVLTTAAFGVTSTLKSGFESEYVFRGDQLASNVSVTTAEVDFGIPYAGVTAVVNLEGEDSSTEIDVFAGAEFDTAFAVIDVGVFAYVYPENDVKLDETDYTLEPYVGVTALVPFNPSLYAYYDVDLESLTLEVAASQTFVLEGYDALTINTQVFLGYQDAQDLTPNSVTDTANSYSYYGGTVDLVYSLTEKLQAAVGLRFTDTDDVAVEDSKMFWGASVAYTF